MIKSCVCLGSRSRAAWVVIPITPSPYALAWSGNNSGKLIEGHGAPDERRGETLRTATDLASVLALFAFLIVATATLEHGGKVKQARLHSRDLRTPWSESHALNSEKSFDINRFRLLQLQKDVCLHTSWRTFTQKYPVSLETLGVFLGF